MMPTLAYYISSHGFGHAARSRAIMGALIQSGFSLIAKTLTPASFFKEFAGKPFEIQAESFDCGCLQHDAARIDWPGTFDAYRRIEMENASKLETEAEFLRRRQIRAVVCDVPSFPVLAAARAAVPCFMIANFTWADIYEPHARGDAGIRSLVERLKAEYAQATLLLRTPMGLEMSYFPRIQDVPVITRRGCSVRKSLCARLGLDEQCPLYLIYVGSWGLRTMRWENLAAMKEAHFLTVMRPPCDLPPNLTVMDVNEFPHEDLTASMDAVIAKPGYGICAECIAADVPLLYTGREEFAEFAPMERDLARWGGAIRIPEKEFARFALQPYLSRIPRLSISKEAFGVNGAEVCARIIKNYRP
ncbi:MAG: hypothetical protein NTX50_14555 [Candidatus Sumerlaeota bacterium]|nr:hypothetical protein [Candidatus Sumerlaeota bacterium]